MLRDHTIAKCPVAGSDQIRQTRNLFRKKMIDFRESGGSFCSRQCQLSMNISLFSSDRNLDPECACESAVLDALSAIMGDPDYADIKELKQRATSREGEDLHTWLCSTEKVGGGESATATKDDTSLLGSEGRS